MSTMPKHERVRSFRPKTSTLLSLAVLLAACTSYTNSTGGSGGTAGSGGSGGTGGTGATGGSGGTGGATGGSGGTGGGACPDADQDGYTTCQSDCDDADPFTNPAASEICDGVDNDCDGADDAGAPCNGIGTFVAGDVGDDANPGTKAQPLKTINAGIQNALALGKSQPVFVAGSHYPEVVTLVEGVDLLGGYECNQASCTWDRDPAQNDTAILAQDYVGVLAPTGVTRATKLEGFRIQGKDGTPPINGCCGAGVALTLDEGSPTITGNVINGGAISNCGGSYCGSVALQVTGAPSDPQGAEIVGNQVQAGDAQNWSVGVGVTGGGVAEIHANLVNGGLGDFSRAVTLEGQSTVLLYDNDIVAGSCKGANGSSFGLMLGNTSSSVDANRINLLPSNAQCATPAWSGGIEAGGGNVLLTNNVVRGMNATKSCAVNLRDGEVPIGIVAMNANTLDAAGAMNVANTQSAALVLGPLVQGNAGTVGSIRNNILLGGDGAQNFCVYEDSPLTKSLHPVTFENNDLFDGSVLYRFWNGTTGSNLDLNGVNSFVTGGANFSEDPELDATYHLTNAQNACVDAGTDTGAPGFDMDGDARTPGEIDVGADELN